MRMKSILLSTILLLCVLTLPAANLQKVYGLDSSLYRNLATLYLLQGKALPSTSLPYNEDEAHRLLARIDQVQLDSETEKVLYTSISRKRVNDT